MLEIGDNFIVLNNVVWKRIGFYTMIDFEKTRLKNQVGLYMRYPLQN